MLEVAQRASGEERAVILRHYALFAPWIAASFAGVPLVVSYAPGGLGAEGSYSGAWRVPLPASIPSVCVRTPSGEHVYPGCSLNSVLWLAERDGIGMHSWTPNSADPESVGVARILLRPIGGATQVTLKEAMLCVRAALFSHGLEAIPLFDGVDGAALFIPLGDAPLYDAVRAWLHTVLRALVARFPSLLAEEQHGEKGGTPRIRCAVASNAPGRFSSLPYSINARPGLRMVTPIDWPELGTFENGSVCAANAAVRAEGGDRYAAQAALLKGQLFADAVR